MQLQCIAIDDESLGRKLLQENIGQIPFLKLVGTGKNAFEAMDLLEKHTVDLMFLDIQMPGMLGTNFLKSLRQKPMVILVTAYSNYAVESYDLEVVDYLMKPVSLERFTKAAYKALDLFRKNQEVVPLSTPPTKLGAADSETLYVNVEYSLKKILLADVTHIEGMKDYVKIHLCSSSKPVITKATLKGIGEKLPNNQFLRVHKSFIINLEKIESIRNHRISIGEHEIPVSEANMDKLLKELNHMKL